MAQTKVLSKPALLLNLQGSGKRGG
uniref:Uncharacterized protein n=1 Tax=Arundo donax TaxID=35708 RepID=A0A0A9F467_ARUDO